MKTILHQNCNWGINDLYLNLIKYLSEFIGEDYNILVYAPVKKKEYLNNNKDETLKNVEYFYKNNIKKYHKLLYYNKMKAIYKDLEKDYNVNDICIGHAPFLFTDGGVIFELFRRMRIPYIVGVKDTDLNSFFKHLFYLRKHGLRILKKSEKIIFLSPYYQKRLIENYVSNELIDTINKKAIIIPNGIDDYWIRNQIKYNKKKNKVLKISFVGDFIKRKNIIRIIKSIEKIRKNGLETEFHIAGDTGNKLEDIMNYCHTFDWCKFHGRISNRENLKDFYAASDIFVMPSLTESFGLVYGEAISQGVPVVYTKGEGFDGQFPEGYAGFSVNPYSIDDIANGIIKVYDNYEKITGNLIGACNKFSWKSIALKYWELFQEILEKNYSCYDKKVL